MRVWLSIVMLAFGAGLPFAAGPASVAEGGLARANTSSANRGGTLRVDLASDFDFIDPALAYYAHSWNLLYQTSCKLLTFPPKEARAGGTRLTPEVAAGLPVVSANGKTYTFTLRKNYRFADGSQVTAANFVAAFNRDLQPKMSSPATSFIEDVVGARAVLDGKAARASGVRAIGKWKLQIRLTKVAPDFLARITLPFFSAIRTNTAITADGIAAPNKGTACGPYYVANWEQKRTARLVRNPFYKGNHPSNPDAIEYTIGIASPAQRLRVESNETDLGGFAPAAAAEIRDRYGVNASHTGRSPSFYVRTDAVVFYLNMNNERALFRNNDRLRRAVNHAIDRPQMVRQHGALGGTRTDQILPVGFPGFENWDIYSLKGANLTKARQEARGATRTGKCEFWTFNSSFGPPVAQIVQFNLEQIGIDCNITSIDRIVQTTKAGVRGAEYDLLLNGWGQDYPDPYDFINILLSGTSIQPDNNINLSYFNSPTWNKRMERASRLIGQARYRAYALLDRDLMKGPAPLAPYINTNARMFVSKRVGCYVYQQAYGSMLGALCLRG